MKEVAYLYVIPEPGRVWELQQLIDDKGRFTDTFSAPDWPISSVELFLISVDGESIQYVALGRRGNRVASYKFLITFTDVTALDFPMTMEDLIPKVDMRARRHLPPVGVSLTSRKVPPKAWTALKAAVGKASPGDKDLIEQLEADKRSHSSKIRTPMAHILAEEKDAVVLATRFSGMESEMSLKYEAPDDAAVPFLAGLGSIPILEDTMLSHDMRVFGDWDYLKTLKVGAIQFKRKEEVLTVMNVNRANVEHSVGVDLVYYTETYRSYVMVQYKRLTAEGTGQKKKYRYRPRSDSSFASEIDRMKRILGQLGREPSDSHIKLKTYRLTQQQFFFKFCAAEVFEPAGQGMISGMYMPLDYLEVFLVSDASRGSQGGQYISYENVPRHINNSLFIELVQDGWIGSTIPDANTITDLIKRSLEGDRSVMLAAHRRDKDAETSNRARDE